MPLHRPVTRITTSRGKRSQELCRMIFDQTKMVQFGPSVSVWSPEDEQMAFVPCGIVYKCPIKNDVSVTLCKFVVPISFEFFVCCLILDYNILCSFWVGWRIRLAGLQILIWNLESLLYYSSEGRSVAAWGYSRRIFNEVSWNHDPYIYLLCREYEEEITEFTYKTGDFNTPTNLVNQKVTSAAI